jgi:Ca-activated chloride channel family protein
VTAGGPAPHDRRELREQRHQQQRRRRAIWGIVAGVAVLLAVAGGGVVALVNSQSTTATASQTPAAEDEGAGDGAGQASPGAEGEPIVFPNDEPAATAGAEPCTTVRVLSSLENSEMVGRLVDAYNAQPRAVEGNCVTVVATKDKSGLAAEDATHSFTDLHEDERPTVWVPDASSWIGLVRATGGGASVPDGGTSLGASDIVLAMPERSPPRSAGMSSARVGRRSSRPPRTRTPGATSATPSGARSSSARRARSSPAPVKPRCSPPTAPRRARSAS